MLQTDIGKNDFIQNVPLANSFLSLKEEQENICMPPGRLFNSPLGHYFGLGKKEAPLIGVLSSTSLDPNTLKYMMSEVLLIYWVSS